MPPESNFKLNSTSNEHTQDGNVRSTSGEGHTTLGAGGLVDAAYVVFADSGPGCRVDIAGTRTRSLGGRTSGFFSLFFFGALSEPVPGRLSRSERWYSLRLPADSSDDGGSIIRRNIVGPASAASESDIKYQQREPLDCH